MWTSAVGVTVNANSLTKTAANGWGNAGAVSTQQIASGDGYVEFTASETTTYRLLGLSNGNTNTSYEDIDFAIDAYAGGQIKVYENGALKGTFGTYVTGDKLRVAVVGGVVQVLQERNRLLHLHQGPDLPAPRRHRALQHRRHPQRRGRLGLRGHHLRPPRRATPWCGPPPSASP